MMHMSFWFDVKLDDILFKNLSVSSAGGMVAVCVVMVALSIVYEFMRLLLAKVKLYSTSDLVNHEQTMNDNTQLLVNTTAPNKKRVLGFFGEIMIYATEDFLAYILMLLVMTYNGYIFLAVLLGSMVAYAFTGHKMMAIRLKYRNLKIPCQQLHDSKITLNCEGGSNELQPTITSEAGPSVIVHSQHCHSNSITHI